MSEYEGKVPYRNRGQVDLIDYLHYEATGKMMTSEDKKRILDIIKKEDKENE